MKISVTIEAEIPEGPVCANWAYRTTMPPELNYRCEKLRDDSITVTDIDMRGHGSGSSRVDGYRCAMFDKSLRHENGVGVFKCAQCVAVSAT